MTDTVATRPYGVLGRVLELVVMRTVDMEAVTGHREMLLARPEWATEMKDQADGRPGAIVPQSPWSAQGLDAAQAHRGRA